MHGFFSGPLLELRESLGLKDAVEFPGWMPREELLDLYARASACICPSFFEGFGLPLVEALAAGVPTACSNVEPLAGNAGGAALLFDPHDVGAIARAMEALVCDQALRTRLAAAGPGRAAKFSWSASAETTLTALQNAVDGRYS
jgi:glycosyltransferase involved in cell wall biosynthesis